MYRTGVKKNFLESDFIVNKIIAIEYLVSCIVHSLNIYTLDGGEKTQMQGRKLPEPVRNKSAEDFIAHQRAISRQARSGQDLQSGMCEDNPVPNK